MSNEKFHIGRQIARVIEERRMMKVILAEKLGVSESTANHLTKRESIDAELLQKIGNVLQYNFFKHYPVEEIRDEGADKDKVIAEQGARIAELERQAEEMKGLEMTYMKQGYEDLRRANEMLMASLRPTLRARASDTRRKSIKSGERLMLG